MNLLRPITDNVTEVLMMIIEFTKTRQKVLTQNIENSHSPGFVPVDLTADEFSDLLNSAIDEHIRNRRLVLRDTENVKFGVGGSFIAKPVVDENARELLEDNSDEYLESQISKLLENSLSQRIASELLKQRTTAIDDDRRRSRWKTENSTYNE
jgi:flagellar basal body rod protein FlgB